MGSKIRLTGRIIYKGDPGYEQARQNWNPYVDTFPLVFVFAQSTKDVTNAIEWARKNNVPIRARSGRHALDKNLSMVKDGIVIDVSDMKKVWLNSEQEMAIVQTDIQVGPLVKKLAKVGYMVPFGDSPTVGIGGITMGGGMGLLQRSIGLISDHLIELEMVEANGIVLNANKNNNSDLLWATRGGGGGNFGINTEYCFKVHRAPTEATVFEIIWPWNQLEKVFKAWQKWAPFVDNRLGSILEIFSENNGLIHATGLFLGSKTKLSSLLEPLISVGAPTKVFIQELSYTNVVEYLIPNEPITRRSEQNYKISSAWPTRLFPDEAIKIMRSFLEESTGTESSFFFLNCGGAVNRISPEATAFFWRYPKFYLEWNTTWTQDSDASRNLALVSRTRQQLSPFVEGAYVNSPDQNIINFGPDYYGTNFERLQSIKAKYDPENVFHFPQSIPPKF
ncbi:FAD-dependent oxidoreductase [Psychrobacillus sp. NPDC096426]|uniref:FAD-dependent oxidoreductase n=1 Tax=Psychrobacillus sp. NPDC096426 TaxID=3364491 RepID=UPI00382CE751